MTLPLVPALLGLVLGLFAGLVHFASLKRVTALYLDGRSTGLAIGLQLGRLVLLTGVLVVLALQGALPLLAGALGVVAARVIVLRWTKEGS
ncbi:N-ATPase subunit AtpR [Nioella nitratireducens]|uniref:N-ATPase subunit AtpR n=1 Tax=Nioella nitratireducens TaxID=1287720 RepID=UPI0008FD679C|nr:ATP synthase subunit I [Nioella nitratireducens]